MASENLIIILFHDSTATGAVYPVVDVQQSMVVVTGVVRDDGAGGKDLTTYSYVAARQHQLGFGFLGFERVNSYQERTDLQMSVWYSQDYTLHLQYHTLVETVSHLSTSVVLRNETTSYTSVASSYSSGSVWQINIAKHTQCDVDLTGTAKGTTSTVYMYDDYGNVLSSTSTMSDTFGVSTWSVDHQYTYDTTNWRISQRSSSSQTKTSGSSKNIINLSYGYDKYTSQLTRQCATSGLGSDNGMHVCVDYVLDSSGNKVTTTVSGQNRDGSTLGQRVLQSDFSGDKYKRYPNRLTNPLGLSNTVQYDESCAAVSNSATDEGGGSVTIEYNTFCLPTRQVFRDSSAKCSSVSTVSYTRCTAQNECPTSAYYYVSTTSAVGVKTVNYFDSMQRLVSTQTVGFAGATLYSDIVYGSNGKVWKTSTPYVSGETAYVTEYKYDALDRVVQITYPDGSSQTTLYDGPKVSTVNGLGQEFVTYTNMLNQLVESVDAYGSKTTYTYSARGDLLTVTDSMGNSVVAEYDGFGHRTMVQDKDSGTVSFNYDVYGQEIARIDNSKNTFTYNYDVLGRPISRVDDYGIANWTYDKDSGKLLSSSMALSGVSLTHIESYLYDDIGRVTSKSTSMAEDNQYWSTSSTYDCNSRVDTTTLPTGLVVENQYSGSTGHLERIWVPKTGQELYKINSKNSANQVLSMTMGGWLTTLYTYDVMGRLKTIASTNHSGQYYQNLEYTWDAVNNLLSRVDKLQNLKETFEYDDLNRLVHSTITQDSQVTYEVRIEYDAIGNVLNISDVGTMTYGEQNAGPHAITTLLDVSKTKHTYTYDDRGNQLSGTGNRIITWTPFNKAKKVAEDSYSSIASFYHYGAEHQRIRRYDENTKSNSRTRTLWYGDMYEREKIASSSETFDRDYIGTNILHLIHTAGSTPSEYFKVILRDHLGSIDKIVDVKTQLAEVEKSYSYSGQERNPQTWKPILGGTVESTTNVGFENGDMLKQSYLVDFGGRIYDSHTLRFTSPDPYGNAIGNMQALNRYSFVLNRFLSDTDPTGYSHHDHSSHHFWRRFLKAFVKIFQAVADAVLIVACAGPECAAAFEASFSVVKDKVEGDSWKGALFDGFITFMSWEVLGSIDPEKDTLDEMAMKKMTVGVLQVSQSLFLFLVTTFFTSD